MTMKNRNQGTKSLEKRKIPLSLTYGIAAMVLAFVLIGFALGYSL